MCMPVFVRVLLVCASKTIAVRSRLLLQPEGILLEHVYIYCIYRIHIYKYKYIYIHIIYIYVYTL